MPQHHGHVTSKRSLHTGLQPQVATGRDTYSTASTSLPTGNIPSTDKKFVASLQKTLAADSNKRVHSAPVPVPRTSNPSSSHVNVSPAASFSFESCMADRTGLVNAALEAALPQRYPHALSDAIRYSMFTGGKRLRAVLCMAACELAGGKAEWALPTAVALELCNTMSVMQDDLPFFDNDNFRRGHPANHRVFGEVVTILACGSMTAQAIAHITRTTPASVPAEKVVRVILEMSNAMQQAYDGQTMDTLSGGKPVDLDTLLYIHINKTGAAVEAAVVCGAVLGGADEVMVERLRRYAHKTGLAYQIMNDIIDVAQSSSSIGKDLAPELLADHDPKVDPRMLSVEEYKQYLSLVLSAQEEHLQHMQAMAFAHGDGSDVATCAAGNAVVTPSTSLSAGQVACKDLLRDKVKYPKLQGLEQSRQVAPQLVQEAVSELKGYDQLHTAPLAAVAHFLGAHAMSGAASQPSVVKGSTAQVAAAPQPTHVVMA